MSLAIIRPINQALPQIMNKKTAIAAAALLAVAPLTMTSCNNKELSNKFVREQNQELPLKLFPDRTFSTNFAPINKMGNTDKISDFSVTTTENEKTLENKRDFCFSLGEKQIKGSVNISSNKLNGTGEFSVDSPTGKKNYETTFYYKNTAWITKIKDKETGVENQFKFKIEKEDNVAKINAYDKDDKKIFSQDLDKHKWGEEELQGLLKIALLLTLWIAAIKFGIEGLQ